MIAAYDADVDTRAGTTTAISGGTSQGTDLVYSWIYSQDEKRGSGFVAVSRCGQQELADSWISTSNLIGPVLARLRNGQE